MASANKKNAILLRWEKTLADSAAAAAAVLGTDGMSLRTFSEIEKEAAELDAMLETIPPRSVMGIQIGNCASWPALLLAAFRREIIPLPLGRHMEKTERAAALETCRVSTLVEFDGIDFQWTQLAKQAVDWRGEPPDFLKLTSGTTSAPRAIRFRAEQLVADCDNICETMGITRDDVNFGVIPFSHSYGFSNLLTPLLCRGVALVASEERMPRAILHDLARSDATVFPGMPVFFEKILALGNVPKLPRLRLCQSAGAPLPKPVASQFHEKFGLKIHPFYGASECGGICYDASAKLEQPEGFVGQPLKNVRIFSFGSDAAVRIKVRSSAVGDGYFPDADAETLGRGRFIPSDLVQISTRGLRLVGRATDVINVAGRKLNPAEIEARIAALAGVKQVVIFGVPSALRHEEAVACVAGNVSASEVLQFARKSLSAWQRPRDVWIVPEIPVNERGKVSRRELAREYLLKNGATFSATADTRS